MKAWWVKKSKWIAATAIAAGIAGCFKAFQGPPENQPSDKSVRALYKDSVKGVEPEISGQDHLLKVRELFEKTLKAPEDEKNGLPADLKSEWKKEKFDLQFASLGKDRTWVLIEQAKQRIGRGFFVFPRRTEEGIPHLQVPNFFNDASIEDLSFKLCVDFSFRSCAWGTEEPDFDEAAASDTTVFHQILRSLLEVEQAPFVVQMQVFTPEQQESETLKDIDLIISGPAGFLATCLPEQWKEVLAEENLLPTKVKFYGIDIHDSETQTNVAASALRKMGRGALLQFEVNQDMKRNTKQSQQFRTQLWKFIEKAQDQCLTTKPAKPNKS